MNRVNYDAEMQKIIEQARAEGKKPTLLLHACCAPCSSACLELLKDDFDVTVYFYNPNMDSAEEFSRRETEERRLCEALNIKLLVEEYDSAEFYCVAKGFEKEKESGKRCERCFFLRLKKTAEKAKEKGFDYFTTTLTISPLKSADLLNEIGKKIAEEKGIPFLPSDFKKRDGYKKSVELSKKYDLYRQNYCGCVFSKIEREE